MENSSKTHFSLLNEKYSDVIQQTFDSKHETSLSELFHFTEDLTLWYETLSKRTDTTLLVSALQEYELGFQAVVSGQYRYAFVANRYFVEQTCKFIYLSSNEYRLRRWKDGFEDISWTTITDSDNGIFSVNYIRSFFPEIDSEGKHILQLVSTLYRETSEFVHGNFSKIGALPQSIEFNEELLGGWLDNVRTSNFIVLFLLSMRFSKDLKETELAKLEDCIRQELCGIEEFNLLFIR